MSDPENFVSRWSRRKREARQELEKPGGADTPEAASPRAEDVPMAAEPQAAEPPPVDLDSLPPIESITAGSDIRAFLAPGIPAHLTRAALRRAWVADPAIRDFVGLAENAWDFNAPDSVPGFGSSVPLREAQRLLAEMMSDDKSSPETGASAAREPVQMPDVSAPTHNPPEPDANPASPPAQPVASSAPNSAPSDAAVQEEAPEERPTTVARQHGGALPS